MLNVVAVMFGFHVDSIVDVPNIGGRMWWMTYEKTGALFYNEMNGVSADPERIAGRKVLNYLYPSNAQMHLRSSS